jgi:hypothetical protein
MIFGKGVDRKSTLPATARERDNWTQQGQLYRGTDCAHISCPTPACRNAGIKCQKDEGSGPGSDIHTTSGFQRLVSDFLAVDLARQSSRSQQNQSARALRKCSAASAAKSILAWLCIRSPRWRHHASNWFGTIMIFSTTWPAAMQRRI